MQNNPENKESNLNVMELQKNYEFMVKENTKQ